MKWFVIDLSWWTNGQRPFCERKLILSQSLEICLLAEVTEPCVKAIDNTISDSVNVGQAQRLKRQDREMNNEQTLRTVCLMTQSSLSQERSDLCSTAACSQCSAHHGMCWLPWGFIIICMAGRQSQLKPTISRSRCASTGPSELNWTFRMVCYSEVSALLYRKHWEQKCWLAFMPLILEERAVTDPWLAILHWRNTPTGGLDSSLAQWHMSCRPFRTGLPMTNSLLFPKVGRVSEKLRWKRRTT